MRTVKEEVYIEDRPTTSHLGKFQIAISPRGVIRSTSSLVLRWGFRGRRIEWRYFRFWLDHHLEKFKWQYLRGGSSDFNQSTPCLVLGRGFRGRRIEWRHFRFRQIQDGHSAAILEKSNGDISVADHWIYSMFGSRMGFSWSADHMALILV